MCREIAGREVGELSSVSYKFTSRSNKVSPVMAREILSPNLTGLPPTVSMVRYTAVKDSGVSVVLQAFLACVNIGRNFFAPTTDKLGAVANRKNSIQNKFR